MILTRSSLSNVTQAPPGPVGPDAIAWQSFVVAITNPKAYLFFAALFPQFVDTTNHVWPQYLAFAITFVVVELAIMSAYALAGQKLGVSFSRRWMRWFERSCGVSLIAAAVALLLAKRGAVHAR